MPSPMRHKLIPAFRTSSELTIDLESKTQAGLTIFFTDKSHLIYLYYSHSVSTKTAWAFSKISRFSEYSHRPELFFKSELSS